MPWRLLKVSARPTPILLHAWPFDLADQIPRGRHPLQNLDVFIQPGFTNRRAQDLHLARGWAHIKGEMKSIAVTLMLAF
jgi:hypothetical protein